MYQKDVFLFQIQRMERGALDLQHNSCTSHLCKNFRLPAVLTFPGDYKTWTPGLVTQHDPSLIWLILVTGWGNHEARAAMGLNSRVNHVSGQSLKHQSVCVSICPGSIPCYQHERVHCSSYHYCLQIKMEVNTWVMLEKNGNVRLKFRLRLEEFFLLLHPSYINDHQQKGFRADFKERSNFKELYSCFLEMRGGLFLVFWNLNPNSRCDNIPVRHTSIEQG